MGEKIIELYNRFAAWFCRILGYGDRWVHLLVGIVVAFGFAQVDKVLWHRPSVVAALVSFTLVLFLMIAKEIADFFQGERFDIGDIIAGIAGGIVGLIFFAL